MKILGFILKRSGILSGNQEKNNAESLWVFISRCHTTFQSFQL